MAASKPCVIAVTCKPGSAQPGMDIVGGVLQLRVRERAIEGAANEACIRAISDRLQLPRSAVRLTAGASSRHKRFTITGLSQEEALIRLGMPELR